MSCSQSRCSRRRQSLWGSQEAQERSQEWVTSMASPTVKWWQGRCMCKCSMWPYTIYPDRKWDVQKASTNWSRVCGRWIPINLVSKSIYSPTITKIVFPQKLQPQCAKHVLFCCMHNFICVMWLPSAEYHKCMPGVVQ